MIKTLTVRNVNYAVGEGFQWLKVAGVDEDSRNGPVRVAPGPVITEYLAPWERVLFNAERDANPVFHLLESIWMLAGEDDVAFLLPYNARMAEYAEDNGKIHGAYGHRWRKMFGLDQVLEVCKELRYNPESRQAVIQMWSSAADLGVKRKDKPCNTQIYFDCRGGALNMTVCCRSNDALWGAYGANVVHFSVLQEVVAHGVGVKVGVYRQFSNNFHAYTQNPTVEKWLKSPPFYVATEGYPNVVNLIQPWESVEAFLLDCRTMVQGVVTPAWNTHFFHRVAAPLKQAYDMRKVGARTWKQQLAAVMECDWKTAFIQWTERREHVSEQ